MKQSEIKVSVWMLAYNHEKFIAQAIESVIMQQTSFPFDLIIGEDCSLDGTRDIVKSYQQKYPDIVKPIFYENNVGLHENFDTTLKHCKGEYVAMLEGDDYWADPEKLTKQVEFLDREQDYALCYHLAKEIDEINKTSKITNESNPDTFNLDHLLKNGWFMRTCTIMFRNRLFKGFPDWFYKSYSTDYILQLLIAQHGKVKCLKEVLGVYRRHEEGISIVDSEAQVSRYANVLELMDHLDVFFDYRYKNEILFRKQTIKNDMILYLLKNSGKNINTLKKIAGLWNKRTPENLKMHIGNRLKRLSWVT